MVRAHEKPHPLWESKRVIGSSSRYQNLARHSAVSNRLSRMAAQDKPRGEAVDERAEGHRDHLVENVGGNPQEN
jgi:hypothetical protein